MLSLRDLERHQEQSEFGVASDAYRPKLDARTLVHVQIDGEHASPAGVAAAANESPGACFSRPVSAQGIEAIRAVRKQWGIRFSKYEPIDAAAVVSVAASYVFNESFNKGNVPSILFSTDCAYRPHGSIMEFDDGSYNVLLSRYLLFDLQMLSAVLVETALPSSVYHGEGELSAGLSSSDFLLRFQSNKYFKQAPYMLAAVAACEKYRYVITLPSETNDLRDRFYTLCIVFLLAHEISHIRNGDFAGSDLAQIPRKTLEDFIKKVTFPSLHETFDPKLVEQFWVECRESYVAEFSADLHALLITVKTAGRMFSNPDLGFAAATVVLACIAWADREEFQVSTKRDPLKITGKHIYNRVPLGIDIDFFSKFEGWQHRRHPWGKTRLMALGVYLQMFSALEITPTPESKIRAMIQNSASLFTWSMPEAMAMLTWIRQSEGEYIAVGVSDQMVATAYWPDIHNDPDNVIRYLTALDDLYGMRAQVVIE